MKICAYSMTELEHFLDDFYAVSGISININNFGETDSVVHRNVTKTNFCRFCKCKSDCFDAKCSCMDKESFEIVRSSRKLLVYECHMGMSEAIIPIIVDDEILCIVFLGQILCNPPSDSDFQIKIEKINRLDPDFFKGADINELHDAYMRTTYCPPELFGSYINIVELCAQSFYNNRWIRYRSLSISDAFKQYISDYITSRITIGKTAALLNVSVSHLSRIIKRDTGMSFTEYVMREKIKAAQKLLKETDMPVKKIALYLGIEDTNYFSRIFKKYSEITCVEYRRLYGDMR